MDQIRFADLFCGAGLFSGGFQAAGFTPAFAIDLDPKAIATYNANIADVAIVGSVSAMTATPEVDLVIAGPPCQGFSTLGRRDIADERNQLSLAVPGIASRASAKIAVVENVPPFLSSTSWAKMANSFRRFGYGVQTMVLNAKDYGTPQNRERAFTVASRIGKIEVPHPSTAHDPVTAGEAFMGISEEDPLHVWPPATELATKRFANIPPLGDKRDLLRIMPDECPTSWITLGTQATDVWGRIDADRPSNTIRCRFQNPSTGRYIHPYLNRTISLREGARLQGIPDAWKFSGDRTSIQRQIGNGVPVPLANAIAAKVMALIEQHNIFQAAA
jgi:DNA (cytosine-5)-methyltransferase 1